jgi:hypothetical protein
VLGADEIGVDDDFFALGGTSLLTTPAVARINETFAVELTTLTMLEAPTPGALAERVDAATRAGR